MIIIYIILYYKNKDCAILFRKNKKIVYNENILWFIFVSKAYDRYYLMNISFCTIVTNCVVLVCCNTEIK